MGKYNKCNIKNVKGPTSEKIKKQFQYFFEQKDMQRIIWCNLKVVNCLDVTFNLNVALNRLIENQTMRHNTFTSSQTSHHLYSINVHSLLKSVYHGYYHQKIYFWRLASCGKKNTLRKTLRKTKSTILYGLTHFTANH